MRRLAALVSLALAATLLTTALPAQAGGGDEKELEFKIALTGAAERPNPVDTAASGEAEVELKWKDGKVKWIKFEVEVCDIANATAAHVHAPAGTDATAPARLWLYGPGPLFTVGDCKRLSSGKLDGEALAAALVNMEVDDFVEALGTGMAYVNVHTTANPGGEIRGQLA